MRTAGLVSLKDRKLLLAFSKNKRAFYLPGGKIDKGETSQSALRREILEELNIRINPEELRFYAHITAQAFGEENGIRMEQDCFWQNLKEEPRPGSEVLRLQYFDAETYGLEAEQVPGVLLLMQQLKRENLID
jgi:8-oxo-dGTP pyrophosphatase MutT (NUDIX family)